MVVENGVGQLHKAAAVDTEGWLTSEGQRATPGSGRNARNAVRLPRKEGTGTVRAGVRRDESLWRSGLLRGGDRHTHTHVYTHDPQIYTYVHVHTHTHTRDGKIMRAKVQIGRNTF